VKLAVTGAGGFIGAHVVDAALERNYEVRILVRSDARNEEWRQKGVEVFQGDLRDSESLKPFLRGADFLCNVAGVNTPLKSRQKEIFESNVDGVTRILTLAGELGVKRIVHTGSTAALGCAGKGRMNNEDTAFNLWDISGDYERSKHLGEEAALQLYKEKGIPVIIAQPSASLGPGDVKPTYTGQLIIDFVTRKLPAYFDSRQNYVDARDVALGHLLALEKGRLGERYLLCNENLLFSEYFALITELTGVSAPKFKPPLGVALLMSYALNVLAVVTRRDPIIRSSSIKRAMLDLYYDNAKARKELGFAPRRIIHSLYDEIAWFVQEGYIKEPISLRKPNTP